MLLGRYNKLIAAIIGNLVGVALVYFASLGYSTCTVVEGVEMCSMFGYSQAEITTAVLFIVNTLAVYIAPKNSP